MFDDLFKTDTKTDTKTTTTPSKPTGMFNDLFQEESKPVSISSTVTPTEPTTPTIATPKKNTFLNTVKSFFNVTSPTSGFIPKKAEVSIKENLIQPILNRTINTEVGKKSAPAYEKGTRGSTTLYATPKAYIETFRDIATGNEKLSNYGEVFEKNFNEAIDEWEKGGEDPSMSWSKKVSRSVLESAPQSAIGVLLNMIPFVGPGLSTAHFATISAAEQINERGQVNSLGNIGIDVIGDQILGGTIEGLFKKPATELLKTGFKETAKQAGQGFIVEGTTEPAQTFLKYANDYKNAKTPDERKQIVENTKEYVKNGGMLLEFLVGGISGAGIGSIASLASQSQIDPNIPKPKLGITEDDDKEYTPEQNKIREAFREDIKQDLTDTGFNKPYVARQISKETGIDNAITTLMVDEVAETIEPTTGPEIDNETIIQQALNEAGSTLEETKTPEAVTEQPKLKIAPKNDLIEQAKKYQSSEEFIKSQGTPMYRGTALPQSGDLQTADTYGLAYGKGAYLATNKEFAGSYGSNISELYHKMSKPFEMNKEVSPEFLKQFKKDFPNYNEKYGITGEDIHAFIGNQNEANDYLQLKGYDGLLNASSGYTQQTVVFKPEQIKTKSQLEEIWNKAQGEAKMKVKGETKKVTDLEDEYITKNIDRALKLSTGYRTKSGKLDLISFSDLSEIQDKINKKQKLTNEDRTIFKEAVKRIGEEEQFITKGLDTLITKEDNKEYGNKQSNRESNNRKNDGEVQPNKGRSGISDENVSISYTSKEGVGIQTRNIRINGRIQSARLQTDEGSSRVILESYLPEVKSEVIDQILYLNNKVNSVGKTLIIKRSDTYRGRTDFDAFIQQDVDQVQITVNNADILKLDIKTINHEGSGHFWYSLLNDNGRKAVFDKIKEQYIANKSLFDGFLAKEYWDMFPDHLIYQIRVSTGMNEEEASVVLQETGFIDKENNIIYPENILETSFNFQEKANEINNYITKLGYNGANVIQEQNTLMADELNAYVAQESEMFEKEATVPEIQSFSENVSNNSLQFKKEGTEIPFGGVMLKLKDTTKLTSADIIKKHANIQLKREIVITDVYGEKATLKAGEGITPYEVTGNKFILQDGEAYLVSKSQAQNVINNSKTGEAKPFAPELKQTDETVKGYVDYKNLRLDQLEIEKTKYSQSQDGAIVKYNGKPIVGEMEWSKGMTEDDVKKEAIRMAIEHRFGKQETKYSQYTLPGGENYKEILIKAPLTEQIIPDGYTIDDSSGLWNIYDEKGNLVVGHRGSKEEALIAYNTEGSAIRKTSNFKSSHWDEPNVISHIRMNERTYNGKKVAFMEELQSDWAREARNNPTPYEEDRATVAIGDQNSKNNKWVVYQNEEPQSTFATEAEADAYAEELNSKLPNKPGVPTHPLLKNWQELSIKRALQEAVNSNAKYFAWINGPQTAARYNLSKEIDTINWIPFNSGRKINIVPKEGRTIEVFTDENGKVSESVIGYNTPNDWKGKKINEIIGKGIAEKVMATEDGNLSGEGLNMGGEWASNLYDRQVRTIVENLTGQKVEMLDMGLPVDKIKDNLFRNYTATPNMEKPVELTEKNMKVGDEIADGANKFWIITNVMGNGKFKAVPKEAIEEVARNAGLEEIPKDIYTLFEDFNETNRVIVLNNEQTFNISEKTTQQMAIEITPEVKQIVKGEAPQVKVSGKLPFTEQITAPVMFKIKKPEESLISLAKTMPKDKFVSRIYGSATQYGDYFPQLRHYGMEDYKNITELGVSPDEMVTIYRGIDDIKGKIPRKINDGDFVTTDFDSAMSYAGKDNVVSMEVPANTLYTDAIEDFSEEPFYTGSEYVYTKQKVEPKTKSELEAIWEEANQIEPAKFKIKLPDVNTGSKLEDAKQILAHVENKLGVSSIVNSIKDKETAVEIAKEVLDLSPMKELEPYVADAGAYKGTLPEVTGKTKQELKKNRDFRGVKNEKTFRFAQEGDEIAQEIVAEYGMDIDSNEVREKFEEYKDQKEMVKKQEKDLKEQKNLFKTTDTFKMAGIDKTLIGEITQTREMPQAIMEIMDQVRIEKKARREEVLNHKARPLMKYVDKKTQRLPKLGTKTAFGKEGEQILKDLKFEDVNEANKALADYISKRNEFVNPVSRLALQERAAKFLRDKQKILEEVEKKIRAEGRDRKSKLEAIRDFFYMTEGEMRDAIGDKDYRLISENEFNKLLEDVREKSLEIAQHAVSVAEVEWTIAQKELHRVENLQQALNLPEINNLKTELSRLKDEISKVIKNKSSYTEEYLDTLKKREKEISIKINQLDFSGDLSELSDEKLDKLNKVLGKYEHGDVFLGVREMETLAKNANLPDVKTQRQILEEVLGKRTGLPIEKLREIVVGSFDDLRSAVSLSRQNAFYEVMVSDFYQLKIEAGMRYREIEQKTNELIRKARQSRSQNWKQKLAPTDDMVIAYLEEGDLETKSLIAKDMSREELELAHYVKNQYAEMRDFLIARQQLEKERQNYYTHRPRGFFEAWLRDGVVKSPSQFIKAFGRAFKETFIDVNKMDEATFKILNEQTSEILPLEKFFKYSMRRSGQLIPTKNLANAFLGYTKTFELKKGLDQYMPRMEAVARALTPTETTEGGIVKDTSLEKFVKKWINTQKGRPVTVGPIQPGGVLDGLLRGGVAFTRFLDLALRIPAQFMSLVGEETSTWINIGTKKYVIGEYRAKTKQGNKIVKKYEDFVGTKFWDKMREESSGVASKLGETLFAFYGIAARNANIHHMLGVLTGDEFRSGEISPERLVEIKMEMNRWRADNLLHSVMGKTSVGAVFREHKSWAIPIVNQTLSNLKTLTKMVQSGEYQQAGKSKEFGELFRGTLLTLILLLTITRIYKDLKEKKDRNLGEELMYRAMNDAQSFIAALSPRTLFTAPRLVGWLNDLTIAVTSFAGALVSGDRTATGDIPGAKGLGGAVTPKLIKPLFKETEEDKVNTSILTGTIKAQTELDVINPEITKVAQATWEEVKNVGVGTEEANTLVNEISDEEYEAYKLVKKADDEYWSNLSEKVTPIVHQAFKLEFGTEEANKLVENLSDDEYEMYKKVKSAFYGKGEGTAMPSDWDKQSFLTHVTNMAKGWTTDPVDAFNKLIKGGDWKITDIKNGQIIVDRMPVDASEKIKTEAAKNNKNYKLDHIVSIKAGGGNDKNNLNIISTDEWEENTPVEVYLIKQLDAGNISGKKAKEYMVRFKIGRGQITEGKLFEEYKTPITFEEIKQEIAK